MKKLLNGFPEGDKSKEKNKISNYHKDKNIIVQSWP